MQYFPDDILAYIILLLTDDYREVIRFGTVCRSWKEVADCSIIWCKADLKFNPNPKQSFKSVLQGINLALFPNYVDFRFRKDVRKVVVYNNEVNVELAHEKRRAIRNRFMGLLRAYRLHWRKYDQHLAIRLFLASFTSVLTSLVGFLTFLSLIGLLVSFPSLFSSCIPHCTWYNALQHFAFLCLHALFLIFDIIIGTHLLDTILTDMLGEGRGRIVYFGDDRIDFQAYSVSIFLLLFVQGFYGSIILWHAKLLMGYDHIISVNAVILPQWICNLLIIAWFRQHWKHPGFLLLVAIGILLPACLNVIVSEE